MNNLRLILLLCLLLAKTAFSQVKHEFKYSFAFNKHFGHLNYLGYNRNFSKYQLGLSAGLASINRTTGTFNASKSQTLLKDSVRNNLENSVGLMRPNAEINVKRRFQFNQAYLAVGLSLSFNSSYKRVDYTDIFYDFLILYRNSDSSWNRFGAIRNYNGYEKSNLYRLGIPIEFGRHIKDNFWLSVTTTISYYQLSASRNYQISEYRASGKTLLKRDDYSENYQLRKRGVGFIDWLGISLIYQLK